ncbi:hypothetical protein AQUCO_00700914v1 [Aquilegia coerulea]|uniref:Uncharacterized protein n=1 Tax=Aquilegia coerulea TaxID=218851 RepID=A0A2G5EMA9_AQUCA|nr:hypothetical protein AQUCO_00700914v1 [Aquilegia coerulea]
MEFHIYRLNNYHKYDRCNTAEDYRCRNEAITTAKVVFTYKWKVRVDQYLPSIQSIYHRRRRKLIEKKLSRDGVIHEDGNPKLPKWQTRP